MLPLVSGNVASCLHSISCPCGTKEDQVYIQCVNETSDEMHTCEIWANCETCESNTSYCLTCPPDRFGPTCEEATTVPFCYHPGAVENAIIEDDNSLRTLGQGQVYFPGEELTYLCIDGYEIEGVSNLVCTLEGEWSNDPPICRVRTAAEKRPILKRTVCPNPIVDPNGAIDYHPPNYPIKNDQGFEAGSQVSFTCNIGYELNGSDSIICLRNGKWTNDAPTCKRMSESSLEIMCPDPSKIQNGGVIVYFRSFRSSNRGLTVVTRLRYDCMDGYRLEGEKYLFCMEDGSWSGNAPRCIEDCGRSTLQAGGKVTYGTNKPAGEFPWTVFLFMNDTKQTCTGVLLDHETVLTAAHCLVYDQDCTIYFGKYMRSTESDDRYVEIRTSSAILKHPEFNINTFENDIAIVKFYPNVSYSRRIEPICMPSPNSPAVNVTPGLKGYVSGWGLTENRLPSSSLMSANLYVQTPETCMAAYQKRYTAIEFSKGMFCAGLPDGNINTCMVGSGSPLVFYNNETNRLVLGGLASHGMSGRCDLPGSYPIFTRVSHYLQWIYHNLNTKM
ncbi:Mannan-binding lectin serine protease 2 like protein [Argiope bruennichi]|uniref:Mannan-binding lectin serine protease 2 like protein n=2 Tax=Argiope bruennichi TaxID=94029 RepID=A0A8T0EPN6_ARGBR|nr:Mannan-binding lectin serine protease 2 like protein [Argiope bruennichi]